MQHDDYNARMISAPILYHDANNGNPDKLVVLKHRGPHQLARVLPGVTNLIN